MMIPEVLEAISFASSREFIPSIPVDTMPLPRLLDACREQIDRFKRGSESDPQFCLELFRRALDARDSDAWRGLVELYQPLLIARLLRQGFLQDPEEIVQEAFVTLWLKSRSGVVSTQDHTLAQVLHYLWGSVRFAAIKLRRQQHNVGFLEEHEPYLSAPKSSSEVVERAIDAQVVLTRIHKLLTQDEWRVLSLRFQHDVPPREIASALRVPVEEVHGTLASAKRRLRNDPQLRTLYECSEI